MRVSGSGFSGIKTKSKYIGEVCYEFSCPSYECVKTNPYYIKEGGGKENTVKETTTIQKKL